MGARDVIRIPAVFMRGGTSKGLFFHAHDLPADQAGREAIFLAALGSPDRYGRQLDGMGGGISSLSKAVVIGPATRPDADVDYLVAQVSVDQPLVDYGGTCGNLMAAVAVFAVEEGLAAAAGSTATVRIHAVNTGKIIVAQVPLLDGAVQTVGTFAVPGVDGHGAPIRLEFLDAGGTRTGRVLPTGNPIDLIDMGHSERIAASLVDAANPCVFVAAADVGLTGAELPAALDADRAACARLEAIRAAAGVLMGFGATPQDVSRHSQSSPKVAIVAPALSMPTLDSTVVGAEAMDLSVRMVSIGKTHRAVPVTGALCVATAACIAGTVVHAAAGAAPASGALRIGTPSGVVPAAAVISTGAQGLLVERAVAYRTARRLMEGRIVVPARL